MDPIKDFLEIVKLAKAQTHRNLVLFPLLAPESGESDYLTLEEALKEEAVSAIYERQSGTVEDYTRHFRPVESQVGAVFLINGRVVGLDSFGKPDTLSKVFKKLVQSYALDAIDFLEPGKEIKVSRTGVSDLIESTRSAGLETRPSVGLGTDLRLDSRKVTGFALALDGQVVHLSVFDRPKNEQKGHRFSRMGSFSNRRRNRE